MQTLKNEMPKDRQRPEWKDRMIKWIDEQRDEDNFHYLKDIRHAIQSAYARQTTDPDEEKVISRFDKLLKQELGKYGHRGWAKKLNLPVDTIEKLYQDSLKRETVRTYVYLAPETIKWDM